MMSLFSRSSTRRCVGHATASESARIVRNTSVNAVIVDALTAEVERVRNDEDFTSRAKRLLERDKELLERLAR